MRSGDVRAMEDGWISRAHPRPIPVTSGSLAGRRGWRTQLPARVTPGRLSPPRPWPARLPPGRQVSARWPLALC